MCSCRFQILRAHAAVLEGNGDDWPRVVFGQDVELSCAVWASGAASVCHVRLSARREQGQHILPKQTSLRDWHVGTGYMEAGANILEGAEKQKCSLSLRLRVASRFYGDISHLGSISTVYCILCGDLYMTPQNCSGSDRKM